jgi:uncharacterized protein YndB with AHSA1/START domain
MIPPLTFEFSVDKPTKTILVYREFAAERPLVWAVFTQHELLDQWWAPQPWKAQTKTMDFRDGGQWQYAMVGSQGEKQWGRFQYTSIQPPEHFTAHSAFTNAEGQVNPELPQSIWTIKFMDKGPLTRVEIRITYEDLAQLEAELRMGFQEGFTQTLAGLDQRLAAWH